MTLLQRRRTEIHWPMSFPRVDYPSAIVITR